MIASADVVWGEPFESGLASIPAQSYDLQKIALRPDAPLPPTTQLQAVIEPDCSRAYRSCRNEGPKVVSLVHEVGKSFIVAIPDEWKNYKEAGAFYLEKPLDERPLQFKVILRHPTKGLPASTRRLWCSDTEGTSQNGRSYVRKNESGARLWYPRFFSELETEPDGPK